MTLDFDIVGYVIGSATQQQPVKNPPIQSKSFYTENFRDLIKLRGQKSQKSLERIRNGTVERVVRNTEWQRV